MRRQNRKELFSEGRRPWRRPLLTLFVEGHPDVEKLTLMSVPAGTGVLIETKDGTSKSRLVFLFYPRYLSDFRCSSGRFFLDCRPCRGRQVLRLYWHSFRDGRDLALTGAISGRRLIVRHNG